MGGELGPAASAPPVPKLSMWPSSPTYTEAAADAPSPPPTRLALAQVWHAITRAPMPSLMEVFGIPSSANIEGPLTATAFMEKAGVSKLQRELAKRDSIDTRARLISGVHGTLAQLESRKPENCRQWDELVRDLIHTQADWSAFHKLDPCFGRQQVRGDLFAAAVRFQLRLRSVTDDTLPPTMSCECRNRAEAPTIVFSPAYHAHTCGFGALIRKLTHDHVVGLTVELVRGGKTLVPAAIPREEAESPLPTGPVPDIRLALHAAVAPSTELEFDHADITIASLVTAVDYAKPRARLCDQGRPASDHKPAKFDAKQRHHGSRDIPIVFDVTGAVEPRSREFLITHSLSKARLRTYKLLVAAAMCRMIGRLDARNRRKRAHQNTPGGLLLPAHAHYDAAALSDYVSMPAHDPDEPPDYEDYVGVEGHIDNLGTGGALAAGPSSLPIVGASS
jgi:hypothetical protein